MLSSRSPMHPPHSRFCLLTVLFALATPPLAADAPEEEAAVKALMRVASEIQKNRDGTARFARFSRPTVSDDDLRHLAALRHLDYLAIVTPTISDDGLKHMAGLTNLDTLYLSGTQLTDHGLPALAQLDKLERLYLDGTRITDDGLSRLAHLENLKTLSLCDTQITGTGLAAIARLPKLESLLLSGTAASDAALEQLAGLIQLKVLFLDRTAVRGDRLDALNALEKLETLNLAGTAVPLESIRTLHLQASLKHLRLVDTPVPPDALAELKKLFPKTTITLSPPPDHRRSAFERFRAGELQPRSAPPGSNLTSVDSQLVPPARDRFARSNETPDFQRHVLPLLGRLGCNGRACHGSFQGKGGFALSMFGYDFDADIHALTAGDHPRVDRDAPDDSLILLKPTMQLDHGGKKRLEPGSWEYDLIRRWIHAGAPPRPADAPKLVRFELAPAHIVFQNPSDTIQLRSIAVWSDGTREDVTCLTRFQTNNETVAIVSSDGIVQSVAPGDTHVVAFYDNGICAAEVILPLSQQAAELQQPATRIDELVHAKLARMGIVPSDLCSDAEFLRRASLDIAGTSPTPDQVRAFTADTAPDKRARKIDELLDHPAHVEWWTNLLCDLTGTNAEFLGTTDMNQPAAGQWRDWIRRRLRDNAGWHEIVAGILLAHSRRPGQSYDEYAAEQSAFQRAREPADYSAPDNPMHYYWFRSNLTQPEERALSFGYLFLGVRLECAQCHKHPYDQWSKQDFEQFTQFFSRIKMGVAPDALVSQTHLKTKLGVPDKLNTAALRRQMYMRVAAEGQAIPWNEIYIDPPSDRPQFARLLGSDPVDINQFADPREPLFEWLIRPDNPYFARAIVNRVWAHYFGNGIVDPPDDLNMANPPSNQALLDYLCGEFVAHRYDLKWLHRTIANSRTYQLSWQPNDTNRRDERNFSRAVIRRLPAEVVVDAILQATASDKTMTALAAGAQSRKIAQHPLSTQARSIDYSLLVFGKPRRTTNCDCERERDPSLLQALYVRNDQELIGWLERKDGWLAQVAAELGQSLEPETTSPTASAKDPRTEPTHVDADKADDLIRNAYLRTVCRLPADAELARARGHLAEATNTVEGLRDLMWALLNTQEFLTNH